MCIYIKKKTNVFRQAPYLFAVKAMVAEMDATI